MRVTDAMVDAVDVGDMAEAFHPSERGQMYHGERALDAIEAALLYGAKRISKREFLQVVGELDVMWDDRQLICSDCGTIGNEEDLAYLGEPCPRSGYEDDDCSGVMLELESEAAAAPSTERKT